MCVWPFILYVHATKTTNCHTKERRNYEYSKRCSQCRKELVENDYVAAHVVSYPCFYLNCCIGILSLKTTCKRCNNLNKNDKRILNYNSCMACTSIEEPCIDINLGYICFPVCCHYHVSS
jgi:hypothetical protein